jgi:hypothetical protein
VYLRACLDGRSKIRKLSALAVAAGIVNVAVSKVDRGQGKMKQRDVFV